ncbi:MAG: T9SS type A sorting domain-containing protein [Bacteroides sp.]|nr:T9SS type A sorting domain-containing protein [Ruminococcus flavefaciens]MCM1555238.1 T9SS type A sorting domain-containing protein [Bacteroides sp.]
MKTKKYSGIILLVSCVLFAIGTAWSQKRELIERRKKPLDKSVGEVRCRLYSPKLRLYGDTLYVPTTTGLYRKCLSDTNSVMSRVGFEGLSVVDIVKQGECIMALLYGNPQAGARCLFLSEDGGRTCRDITYPLQETIRRAEIEFGLPTENTFRLLVNPLNANTIWLIFSDLYPAFYRTYDFGRTWNFVWPEIKGYHPVLAYHPLDTTMVFTAGSQPSVCVYASMVNYLIGTDENWHSSYRGSGSYGIYDLAFHPENPDIMMLSDVTHGLFKSADQGQTWIQIKGTEEYGITKIVFDERNPEMIYGLSQVLWYWDLGPEYVVTMYRSDNGGETWNEIYRWIMDIDEMGPVIDVVQYKGNLIFYSLWGEVSSFNLEKLAFDWMIPIEWGPLTTPVERSAEAFNLTLYPNPVRDVLHFKTEEKLIWVVITDMSGRVVKTKALSGNEREISVSDLRAGMYVVCFYTNNGSVRKKVCVL